MTSTWAFLAHFNLSGNKYDVIPEMLYVRSNLEGKHTKDIWPETQEVLGVYAQSKDTSFFPRLLRAVSVPLFLATERMQKTFGARNYHLGNSSYSEVEAALRSVFTKTPLRRFVARKCLSFLRLLLAGFRKIKRAKEKLI